MNDDAVWNAFSARLFDQNKFAIKLGLDNIRRAFALSGHPERAAPAIVVGGTNGKGGTASQLAATLQAYGLRVGLFTSPHLLELRERFRIDGVPAPRDLVLHIGREVMDRFSRGDSDPCLTFFELTTLLGARLFADANVDVVVWEVGLGGRLDAVNAIEPALTVITNIGFDHQQYLGDSIEEIAREKAGLRREGVPLVLGPQTYDGARGVFAEFPEVVEPVFEELGPIPGLASERHANLGLASQWRNAATAELAAATFLRQVHGASDAAVQQAVASGRAAARWPGRFDFRTVDGTTFLLDAAHNPLGVRHFLDVCDWGKAVPDAFVVGAMADKPIDEMFGELAARGSRIYLAEIDSRRAASLEQLRSALGDADVAGTGSAPEVFERASIECDGIVAVLGSIYLLGEWFGWAGYDADDMVTYSALDA